MERACLCVLFLAILSLDVAISAVSPTPAPEISADGPSVLAPEGSPFSSPPSPRAPSPDLAHSPDSPPDSSPGSSPAPSTESSVPVPAPSESDVEHIEFDEKESEGIGGGRKAGIALGVIAAAGFVAGAGCVLKKRRENERRAQYGYAMRRDFL